MNNNSYQAICDDYLAHVATLSHKQMLIMAMWIIRHIAQHVPDDFADKELPSEKPLLIRLRLLLLADDWDIDAINDTLQKLQDVADEYGDDYPADMNALPLILLVITELYTDMYHLYINHTKMLTNDMIRANCEDIVLGYLDYLDYLQDETYPDTGISLDEWGGYPIIQNGMALLNTQIKH